MQITIFPTIKELIKPGGLYKGYLPVIQGNNTGPHTNATYINYFTSNCKRKNWKWELQALQMPHANNLDLLVSPQTSKCSMILNNHGNRYALADEIWQAAEKVWKNLPSADIAKGFVLAYRIAEKVIKNGGENTFLQKTDFHSFGRRDFADGPNGVIKKIT